MENSGIRPSAIGLIIHPNTSLLVDELGRSLSRIAESVLGLSRVIEREFTPAMEALQKQERRRKELRRLAKERIHGRR